MAKLGGEVRSALGDGRALLVRDARTRDARPLTRLLDAVAAEPEPALLMRPGQWPAGVWRRRIADTLAEPRALQLSALVGNELVGNLGLRPDPHPCSPHVAVLGMSVSAVWRSRGVGGALIETAALWAAANGYTRLCLGVFPENRRAIAFYERHGFAHEGVRRAQYDRDGVYHDEVLMARFLTPGDAAPLPAAGSASAVCAATGQAAPPAPVPGIEATIAGPASSGPAPPPRHP